MATSRERIGNGTSVRKKAFSLAKYEVPSGKCKIKLDANESTAPMPAQVRKGVMKRLSCEELNRYPSGTQLRELIASAMDLEMNNVWLGNGSSELIAHAFAAFAHHQPVLIPHPSFSMYEVYAQESGSQVRKYELNERYKLEAGRYIEEARGAALSVICTPNNPTGLAVSIEDVERIARSIKGLLLVDEAYIEYSGKKSSVSLIEECGNVLVMRTLSKAYGLANVRIGYAIGTESVIERLQETYLPYHMSGVTEAIGAAVYAMKEEYASIIHTTWEQREATAERLRALPGVQVYPSDANFLLVKMKDAEEVSAYLRTRSISVRTFNDERLKGTFRLTIGTAQEMDEVLNEIEKYVEKKHEKCGD